MEFEFSGEVWYWRGPSPHHFVTVPPEFCGAIRDLSAVVSYGWGVIPVGVRIGMTRGTTSLFPKDGGYIVPLKVALRKAEGVALGDTVHVELTIG